MSEPTLTSEMRRDTDWFRAATLGKRLRRTAVYVLFFWDRPVARVPFFPVVEKPVSWKDNYWQPIRPLLQSAIDPLVMRINTHLDSARTILISSRGNADQNKVTALLLTQKGWSA